MMNRTYMKVRKMAVIVMTAATMIIPTALTASAATVGINSCINESVCTDYSTTNASTTGTYIVYGTDQYLALRNDTCYSRSNEIGRIYNGDTVQVTDVSMGYTGYVYVYSPTLNMNGYVNKSYLTPAGNRTTPCGQTKTVKGTTNYLALRNDTCYSRNNEIGRIFNGDTVQVLDTSMSYTGYVYVYSPTLDMYGYVDQDYLC